MDVVFNRQTLYFKVCDPIGNVCANSCITLRHLFRIHHWNSANTNISDHHHFFFHQGKEMQRSKQLRHYAVTPDSTIEIKVITGSVCWCIANSLILVASLVFIQGFVHHVSSLQHWLFYATFSSTTLVSIPLLLNLTPAITCVLMTCCCRLESLWILTWGQFVFPIALMSLTNCIHRILNRFDLGQPTGSVRCVSQMT